MVGVVLRVQGLRLRVWGSVGLHCIQVLSFLGFHERCVVLSLVEQVFNDNNVAPSTVAPSTVAPSTVALY